MIPRFSAARAEQPGAATQPPAQGAGCICPARHCLHGGSISYPGDSQNSSGHPGLAQADHPYRYHCLSGYPENPSYSGGLRYCQGYTVRREDRVKPFDDFIVCDIKAGCYLEQLDISRRRYAQRPVGDKRQLHPGTFRCPEQYILDHHRTCICVYPYFHFMSLLPGAQRLNCIVRPGHAPRNTVKPFSTGPDAGLRVILCHANSRVSAVDASRRE